MLSSWLRALEPLSSSHAPQLTLALVICGATSLVLSDHRLALLAFLVQRLIVIVLLWPAIGVSMGLTNLIAALALVLVGGGTEWGLRRRNARRASHAWRQQPFAMSAPFRALAAALVLLVAYGSVQTYSFPWLPQTMAFVTVWLIALSLLSLLLAGSGLGTGLGVLGFADGCRVLYALSQPNLLVWGLWSACDVLVALAAAYLRSAGAAAKSEPVGGRP